jgi:hypothetical protein
MTEILNEIRENKKREKCKFIFNKVMMEIKYKDSYDNIIGNYEDTIEYCECCICFELTKNKTKCNHDVCLNCINNINKCPLCRKNLIDNNNNLFEILSSEILMINYIINRISSIDYSHVPLSLELDGMDEMDYLHFKLFDVIHNALPIHATVFLEVDYSLMLGATYIRCYASHLNHVLRMVGHLKYVLTEDVEPLAVIGIEFQRVFSS